MTGQGAGKTTHEFFDVSIDAGVAHLQLNRPDHLNSMARGFWNELPVIVRDIDENARARVIVISSTGKHFCAGMDLSVFAGNGALAETGPDPHVADETFRHLRRAAAGDILLPGRGAHSRDRRDPGRLHRRRGRHDVAPATSATARRTPSSASRRSIIGMTADVGTFPRLCKLIPEGWVRELAYTGRRLPAERAKAIGLVNEVYPDQPA